MATLGGFHPDFHPEPAVFPSLKRILITVDEKGLPDDIELSASGYMAVTSNTIQFGAEFTAAIKAGNWKIEGKIGGDALIRLPFYFDVSDQGQRPREVPRSQPDRRQLQGRTERAVAARPARRGLRLAAVLRCLLERQLQARRRRPASPAPAITSLVPVLADELALPANLNVTDDDDRLVLIAAPRRVGAGRW